MATVSFKFAKVSKLNLIKSTNKDEFKVDTDRDIVFSLEGNDIKSSKPVIEKKDLVIPLIRKNNWRYDVKAEVSDNHNETDLDKKAAAEILEELAKANDDRTKCGVTNDAGAIIPLMMSNVVPEGYETDDKLNVSLRPEVSSLEDYENVPIEHFGKALLRGMGWKKEEGIGASNKKVVKPIEAVLRPKGLGLGADPKLLEIVKKNGDWKKDEDNENFVRGGFVKVNHGPHRDLYGEIESVDEENNRVFVKLTLSGKVLSLSKFILCIVSKKEYKKESKILNKSKYDEHVRIKDEEQQRVRKEEKSIKEKNKRSREEGRVASSHKKKKHSSENNSSKRKPWIRPSLRVRFVDKKYHHGKYFNSKVVIEDVISPYTCICQTENRKLLDGIDQDQLETVIPKDEGSNVMIVGVGKYYNKMGQIMKRDKSACQAIVKLCEDESVIKLHFDEICEYVGELPEYM